MMEIATLLLSSCMANHALTREQLEQRLIAFGIAVCRSLRRSLNDEIFRHIAPQMIRSCTSPAANYSEARAAESKRDFVHKMQLCLKELRETAVWIKFKNGLCEEDTHSPAIARECNELMAIIAAGIRTARK